MDDIFQEAMRGAPGAVLVSVLFIIPGFVWKKTRGIFYPRKDEADKAFLLDCLARSCVVHGVTGSSLYLVALQAGKKNGWDPIWMIVLLFGVPLVFAIVEILATEKGWLRRIAERLKIPVVPVHPIPQAWDHYFSRGRRAFVRVWLRDGISVAGLYGADSYASSEPEDRDLYLQTLYQTDADDNLTGPVPQSAGIWIRGDEIKYIEFLEPQP